MIAYKNKKGSKGATLCSVDIPKICSDQVLIKLIYAGLNRRDCKIKAGNYSNYIEGSTMGSDGCGVVVKVFDNKNHHWLGKEVIINPNVNWGEDNNFPSQKYSILGMPIDGTFAEYIAVYLDRISEKPSYLTTKQAAAIPLASLTAYKAIFRKAKLLPKQSILITGAGGGVSQIAIKMSIAIGANVYVTSGNENKIDFVKKWGVVNGVNYNNNDWNKKLSGQAFDVVLDSSGGSQVNALLSLLKQNGKYVFYGATNGINPKIDLSIVYYNQIQLIGTLMGSDKDFTDMLTFIEKYKIKPEIEKTIHVNKIDAAFELMNSPTRFGKVLIKF